MPKYLLLLALAGLGIFGLLRTKALRPKSSPRTLSATAPSSSTGIALGIYQPQKDTSGSAIDTYIADVGVKPAFAWLPMTWQHQDGSWYPLDPEMLNEMRSRGIMPGLTWEPSKGPAQTTGPNQPDFSWKQIASGRYDDYITQFAKDSAKYGGPFLLRFLHEVDGTWYPWGYSVNGNTDLSDYVAAWKHIVDIFRKEQASNVQFVWCPSVLSSELIQKFGPKLKQAYPGDNYVDWIGLDGYARAKNGWKPLKDVFQPSYDYLTSISSRPVILYETGAEVNPNDQQTQANWIKEGFLTTIPNLFPKVKIAVWFNSKDGSGRDYRLQDSPESMAAWKQVATSPLYQLSLFK